MNRADQLHVVDDEEAVRTALGRLLRAAGYEVTLYASAEAILAAAGPGLAGCILLDLRLPGASGLEVQERLAQRGCSAQVVFLTGDGDVGAGVRAMKRGAVDFLEKPVADDELLATVASALERDDRARRLRAEFDELNALVGTLTGREREVWLEVVSGRLNKQIAGRLGIVERTVKAHRASVMVKLRAGSTADLVRIAERLGLSASPG